MIFIASGHIGTTQPLDHPRFCFHKWPGTYTASASADGADTAWLGDGETWSQWQAGSGDGSVTLTFSEARSIDYIGIAAHTLDLAGSVVTVLVDTGAGLANVPGLVGLTIPDDGSILFLLGPVDVTGVRLSFVDGTAPIIGVLQAGLSMELPRRSTYTALPISESEQTAYRTAQSLRGQVLGRAVESAELAFDVSIQNLPEDWRLATGVNSWQAFTAHVRDVGPFFVATRPSRYPEDVAYGVANERPRFNRARPNREIAGEVDLTFQGYKRA